MRFACFAHKPLRNTHKPNPPHPTQVDARGGETLMLHGPGLAGTTVGPGRCAGAPTSEGFLGPALEACRCAMTTHTHTHTQTNVTVNFKINSM